MSVAAAHPGPPLEAELPEPLPDGITGGGLMLSAALHLGLGAVLILGLPTLFHPRPPKEMPIAVELVTMGPQTQATHPNPNLPQPRASVEPPLPGPPAPKPAPEPAPPRPAPPPSAAAAPPVPPAPAPPSEKPPVPPAPSPAETKMATLPPLPPLPTEKPAPPPLPKPAVEAAAAKPTADRPLARLEARTEAQKYNPGQFDALLKNLAATDQQPSPEAQPQPLRPASGRASAQPRAPLGEQLSANEMDMVREQLAQCWDIPAGARDAKDLVVEIHVVVMPDGMVQQATIVDQARAAGDPFFRAAAESARRAFFNPLCRPLRLPPEKYEVWKDMVVDFSPRDLL